MIRLLNTPIIGIWAAIVGASSIDIFAGLSGLYIFSTPPRFWPDAVAAIESAARKTAIAQKP